MPTLPRLTWGTTGPRALLVHGLSSNAGSWWRTAQDLVGAGWQVTMIDLRGNGAAPAADDYLLAGYASDLPVEHWDLVVAHSLGAAAAVLAAADSDFADRLALVDPALALSDAELDDIRAGELAELQATTDQLRAERPNWHERDIEAKAAGLRRVDREVIVRTLDDNRPWNLLDEVVALAIPTLILGGDPDVYAMLPRATGEQLARQNPLIRYAVIPGSGHSPHRDTPDAALAVLFGWLDEH